MHGRAWQPRLQENTDLQLELTANGDGRRTISPFRELGAYEALWQNTKATFKSIAEQIADSCRAW